MGFKERISLVLDVDSKGGTSGLKSFGSSVREADGFVGKFKAGASSAFQGIKENAKALAIGAAVSFVAFADDVLRSGVAMESLRAKAKTVFGDSINEVESWAVKSAHSMGLTSDAAIGAAASMADLLKPMGFTEEAAATMSTSMVDLSGALAAWSGGQVDAAGVSEILSKAMLGERDGLKGLGISITEAEVSARLAQKGQTGLTGATLAQAKALATQEMILEKSTDAQVAWNDGSMDGAKAANESKAAMAEMQQTLISALLPSVMQLAAAMVPVVEKAAQLVGGLQAVGLASKDATDANGNSVIAMEYMADKMGLVYDGAKLVSEAEVTAADSARMMGNAVKFAASEHADAEDAARALATGERGLSTDLRKAKEAFEGTATATRAMAREYDTLLGSIDDKQAWLNLQDAMDDYTQTMNDAEATDREKEQSGLALQKELVGRLRAIENLPAEKVTDVLTMISQGKYDEANYSIGVLTAQRDLIINPKLGKGAAGSFVITPGSKFASGTNSAAPGMALVGEHGPEIVDMGAGGQKVYTASESARMMSDGGSGGDVFNITVNGANMSGDQIAAAIMRYQRRNGGT